jgi:hypothetical protein
VCVCVCVCVCERQTLRMAKLGMTKLLMAMAKIG